MDKQNSSKNKKDNSSKQGGQVKKGMDSHRSNAQDNTSQFGDRSDSSDCKD